jgi:hypothetical protein
MKKIIVVVLLLFTAGIVSVSTGCQKKIDPKMNVKFDK